MKSLKEFIADSFRESSLSEATTSYNFDSYDTILKPTHKKGDTLEFKNVTVDDFEEVAADQGVFDKSAAKIDAAFKKWYQELLGRSATVKKAKFNEEDRLGTVTFVVNDIDNLTELLTDQGFLDESARKEFTFQFYNKKTGEQRASGRVYAANINDAEEMARSSLEGSSWQTLSRSRW